MAVFFALMTLVFLICFLISWLYPSIFLRLFGNKYTKKGVRIILGISTFMFFVLSVATGDRPPKSEQKDISKNQETALSAQIDDAVQQAQTIDARNKVEEEAANKVNENTIIPYKEAGYFGNGGVKDVNIIVLSRVSRDDLIKLANKLHKDNQFMRYEIYNQEDGIENFTNWLTNYGKVRDRDGEAKDILECEDLKYCQNQIKQGKDAYPFPEQWLKLHHFGSIQEMQVDQGSSKWQLIGDSTGTEPLNREQIDLD